MVELTTPHYPPFSLLSIYSPQPCLPTSLLSYISLSIEKACSLSLFLSSKSLSSHITSFKKQSTLVFFLVLQEQGLEKMSIEKEDFGLSLSLSFPQNPPNPRYLNLMSSSTHSSSPSTFNPQKPSWNDVFTSSDRNSETCRIEERPLLLRGIDVNRLPSGADCEEEAGVSSPNSTVSSVSGKRSEREVTGEDLDMERDCSRGISDEEDAETSRKKLRLTKDQSIILEESFKEHNTLNPKQKLALAKQLGLRARQVEVWFQNRRARTKLKQTEVDCEFLKRCCENLTDENRRLQKEVQELRALKLSPQFYMQMTPPTTLTMCPSCERVAVPSSAVDAATRRHPMAPNHPRTFPVGPWATAAPIQHRTFDTLRPRS